MPSRDEVSAGGVVFRRGAQDVEVLICKDASYHRWVLPKGLINRGESEEQAAVREVHEEGGVLGRVVARLGEPRKYVYRARGVLVFKTVHYFLLEYVSGSEADHDHEMEEVRWVSLDEAAATLAYDDARAVVALARAWLEGGGAPRRASDE